MKRKGFTLIELLVVIAIIAILAVVVVLTLNPAELLRQSRDANRVSDMATLTSALNLYLTDQGGTASFSLGNASNTGISIYDPNASSTCGSLGLPSLTTSTGQAWYCSASTTYRNVNGNGWIPVNLNTISAGTPIGDLPIDPTNQTSTGLFYSYNTNGSQFEVTANLESNKYHLQYGNTPQTPGFPDVISGGAPTVSALFNPTGLVGYWNLNEGSGTTAYDTSGNGNNGTWSGTTSTNGTYYASGIVGSYAGTFNGTNDTVNAGSASSLSPASFTIAAWVYPESFASYSSFIQDGNTAGWALTSLAASAHLRLANLAGGSISGNALPLNTWSFIAATYSSGNAVLYQNGVQTTSGSPGTIGAPNSTFNISPLGSPADSIIDDVRIYNRALSAAEVAALYAAEK